MSKKSCGCCCIKRTNQIWVQDKAIDVAVNLCNVDIDDDDNFCETMRICPVYNSVWCLANLLICPKDCCWFMTNSCSLCCMSWCDICCGDQLNIKCKYVCCTFQEDTLNQYEIALNQGYSRQNAYRTTIDLPPIFNDQSKLITRESPSRQSIF